MRGSNRFRAGWIYSKLNRSVSMYVDVALVREKEESTGMQQVVDVLVTMYNHE